MSAWFYQQDGVESGPIDDAELKRLAASGIVRPDTRVRKEANGKWVTADHVRGLFHRKTEAARSTSKSPPAGDIASPASQTASTPTSRRTPPPLPATRSTVSNAASVPAPQVVPASPRANSTPTQQQWYYMLEGFFSDEIVGPVSEETFLREIRAGKISPKVKVMSPGVTKGGWTQLLQLPSYVTAWKEGEAEREQQKREAAEEKRRLRDAKAQETAEKKRQEAAAAAKAQSLIRPTEVPDLTSPSGAISVRELRDYVIGLPGRPSIEHVMVTRRYADGTSDRSSLGAIFREMPASSATSVIYSPNHLFILTKVRYRRDGLCFEFASLYSYMEDQILRTESSVANDPEAKSLVHGFRQIEAHVEMGIGRDQYCQFVAQISLGVKDFVATKSARYPFFASVIQSIFSHHRDVVAIWTQGSGQSNVQFVGGGFGLQGAVTGMAVGMVLNSLVGASNRRKDSAMNDKICEQWSAASQLLRLTEHVMRSAIVDDDIPMAEIAARDDRRELFGTDE